jgi:hypothetical protein
VVPHRDDVEGGSAPDGKSFDGGQSADVPESVARHWIHCGWASEGSGASALRDPRGLVDGTIAPPVEADEQRKSERSKR